MSVYTRIKQLEKEADTKKLGSKVYFFNSEDDADDSSVKFGVNAIIFIDDISKLDD